MSVKYSIIIPTAFSFLEKYLKPCIESLIKYTSLEDKEIIVISNGSTDETDKYVLSLGKPFKLLSFPEALGYSAACNKGIDVAKGKYIIFCNNDVTFLEQEKDSWVTMLTEPFVTEPGKIGVYKS